MKRWGRIGLSSVNVRLLQILLQRDGEMAGIQNRQEGGRTLESLGSATQCARGPP